MRPEAEPESIMARFVNLAAEELMDIPELSFGGRPADAMPAIPFLALSSIHSPGPEPLVLWPRG